MHFVDCLGLEGREQAMPSSTLISYSNQQGIVDTLPTVVAHADYLINFVDLEKRHGRHRLLQYQSLRLTVYLAFACLPARLGCQHHPSIRRN